MKDLFSEDYKTLMKQNENNSSKWKDILFSRTGRVDIVKMFILCKEIYRYKTIPIIIPNHVIFYGLEKIILKFA